MPIISPIPLYGGAQRVSQGPWLPLGSLTRIEP
jgi:hypothetical protein